MGPHGSGSGGWNVHSGGECCRTGGSCTCAGTGSGSSGAARQLTHQFSVQCQDCGRTYQFNALGARDEAWASVRDRGCGHCQGVLAEIKTVQPGQVTHIFRVECVGCGRRTALHIPGTYEQAQAQASAAVCRHCQGRLVEHYCM